jgi:hypothetical protein
MAIGLYTPTTLPFFNDYNKKSEDIIKLQKIEAEEDKKDSVLDTFFHQSNEGEPFLL